MVEFVLECVNFIFSSDHYLMYIFFGLLLFATVEVVRRCFL